MYKARQYKMNRIKTGEKKKEWNTFLRKKCDKQILAESITVFH